MCVLAINVIPIYFGVVHFESAFDIGNRALNNVTHELSDVGYYYVHVHGIVKQCML
jgi:hypothetical protein